MTSNEQIYSKEARMYNFTHEKAGMQDLDRSKIDQIIHEASVNSEFYRREQERSKQIEEKVVSIKKEIQTIYNRGPQYLRELNHEITKKLNEIESERLLTESWIHIDMDMFYASVEIRDNPELAEKPIAVGDNAMISTANYIARRYGVRSAMPGFIGKKLCEELVFVKPNYSKYSAEGEKIREIFRIYDPEFESMGLDEGNLRVTEYLASNNMDSDEGRQKLAAAIRAQIFEKTRLNASAGIACNKVLAKIATDMGKPNGQFYVPFDKDKILGFVRALKVRKIPGIGKVLEKILNELGVFTCGDILDKKLELYIGFHLTSFDFLVRASLGLGECFHPESRDDQKSISLSTSFKATENIEELQGKLKEFAKEISQQLVDKNASAKNISVTVKNFKFQTRIKSETIARYVFKDCDIYDAACKVLADLEVKEKIRMIGLRVASLIYKKPGAIDDLIGKVQEKSTTSSIKVATLECPICKKSFTCTEKRMQVHVNQCTELTKQKTTSKPQKRGKTQTSSITLDNFYKKK